MRIQNSKSKMLIHAHRSHHPAPILTLSNAHHIISAHESVYLYVQCRRYGCCFEEGSGETGSGGLYSNNRSPSKDISGNKEPRVFSLSRTRLSRWLHPLVASETGDNYVCCDHSMRVVVEEPGTLCMYT